MRAWKTVLVLGLVGVALPTLATFHLTKVVEVFGGTPASPNAHYIVLQSYASGQNFMSGHKVFIYNAAGTLTETAVFPSDVSNGANQAKILVATTEAQSFFNVSADLTVPAEVLAAGGKVCFESIDCVAWGNYSGDSTGVGTPFNVAGGGLPPGRAAKRRLDISGGATTLDAGDDTDDSANDFVSALPAPRNNAGVLGTIPASTCGNGVIEGVEQCDDHNTSNGDGCSSTCATEAGGGQPALSIADVSTTEGNSGTKTLTFTVSLSKTSASAVTYNIATSDGTATAGSDYVASSLTGQSIAAGQTSKTFAVTINGDTTNEANETFNVTVSNVSGATVSDGTAVGTITNDDSGGGGPSLSIADVSTTEGNSGTKLLKFTVLLSATSSSPVTYNIATSDGTATAGSDYVAKTLNNQSIAAGSTSKVFNVTINGDTTNEPDETFNVTVSNVVGATVGDGSAVGTITNDDSGGGTPTLSIADVSTAEGNSGTKTLTFTVSLSAAAAGAVTYNIATSDGTATAGSDYVASSLNGESIAAGQTSKTFAVTINGDTTNEANETFNVTVSNVSGATVSDGTAVGTITNDDSGGGGPTLSIADVSTTEGNSLTKGLVFTVSLSQAASGSVTYDIATSDGTATAGSDYVAKSLSGQSILAGATSKTFRVVINGDTVAEPDETFNVTVSNVTGATVGDGSAVGTITNDDGTLAAREGLASLRWPEPSPSSTKDADETRRIAAAARLLCAQFESPALVAVRGLHGPTLLDDLAGVANAGDEELLYASACPRLPRFLVATAESTRGSHESPGLLIDTAAREDGQPRAELLSASRLFESTRTANGRDFLFATPPLWARVRLHSTGAPIELDILVLGRETAATPAVRSAQARELERWLWARREANPELAVAIAGPLRADALPGFPMGELATPRASTSGEHLLGNAPLLGAATLSDLGEACSGNERGTLACALVELEFLP